MSPRHALSAEVRASLEAVRVARDAARVRARRQTVQARIWFAASLAAAALAAFTFVPRIARWRHARAQVATTAHRLPVAPQPAAPVIAPPAAAVTPAAVTVPAAATAPVEATAIAEAPAVAAPMKARDAEPDLACDTASIRHAPWRLSPDACARAFDADPTNATLALAVAHGALVRGRFADAEQWARRALTLDPKTAESYVIIARAASQDGRSDEARAAYEHYLELAPRGWHKAEARAAVQRAR